MDTGVAIKPAVGIGQTGAVRPSIPVPTDFAPDLPGAKAVSAAPAPTTTQNEPAAAGDSSNAPYISRDVIIDAQTREVIYRVIDARTREIISQVPDEALLRSRAYSRAIADGATPLAAQAKADLEV